MNRFKRAAVIAVLALFVGFQTAQTLHTHARAVTQDNCSICQVLHQTPSLAANAAPQVSSRLIVQRLCVRAADPFVVAKTPSVLRSRAPPAA